eukprot:TRINITY_DN6422_c0_g4_i1.p1 TRINITY_DN6422_c0_g4~~TRINITY_DN6422_c0_g4_i1.p1  ORF type:complete len:1229 (+),score=263.69 TRINITY_DN6422_c0_g4_i1:110-3796(+)
MIGCCSDVAEEDAGETVPAEKIYDVGDAGEKTFVHGSFVLASETQPQESAIEGEAVPSSASLRGNAIDISDLQLADASATSREHAAGQATPRTPQGSRLLDKPQAEVEALHSRLADITDEDLHKEALKHLRRTGLTIRNADTDDYEERPLWGTTPKMLGQYGVGIELYFELLIMLGVVFLAMFVVSMPTTVMCLMGQLIEDMPGAARANIFYRILSYFTVGNLGTCQDCTTMQQMEDRLLTAGGTVKVRDVTTWLGILDGVALGIFLAAGSWFLHYWIPRTVEEQDKAHVTPADYAVRVDHIPRRLPKAEHEHYEHALRAHFMDVLQDTGIKDIPSDAVKEVCLIREYDGCIQKFMEQGEVLEQKTNKEVALVRAKRKHDRLDPGDKEKAKAAKEIATLEKAVQKLDNRVVGLEHELAHQASLQDQEREVCFAYVMFKTEGFKNAVLHKFRLTNATRCFLCLQKHKRRFYNHPMSVTQAGEPTDLYWENLDYSFWWHMARRASTCLLALVLIVGCLPLLVALRSVFTAPNTAVPMRDFWVLEPKGEQCLKLCELSMSTDPTCAPSLGMPLEVHTESGKQVRLPQRLFDGDDSCASPWESSSCRSGGSSEKPFLAVRFNNSQALKCLRVVQEDKFLVTDMHLHACKFENLNSPDYGLGSGGVNYTSYMQKECEKLEDLHFSSPKAAVQVRRSKLCNQKVFLKSVEDILKKHGENTELPEAEKGVMDCYCQQQSDEVGMTFRLGTHEGRNAEVCATWISNARWTVFKQVVGVVAVLLLNQILLLIFLYLDKWARYQTQTDLSNSQMFNLFLSQLFNTAITFTVVGADFHGAFDQILPEVFKIGHGPYDHFDAEWFTTIGTLLFTTFICQVGCATATPILFVKIVDPLLRKIFAKGLVTQRPLNDVFTLPDWTLSLRLAETITIVFCLMMYSAAMPLLYLVGAFYCGLAYWCDKWSLLRGAQKPPAYDAKSISRAVMLMPLAALLHTLVTLFTYGQQDVVPSDWGILSGLTHAIFNLDIEEYQKTMSIYTASGTDVQESYYSTYFIARMVDFGRSSTLVPFVIMVCFLVYYILYWIYRLLSPLLTLIDVYEFEGKDKILCFKRRRARDNNGFVTVETWDEALEQHRAKNEVFSYKLEANPRYKEAHDALQFDPDPEKLQAYRDNLPAYRVLSTDFSRSLSSGLRAGMNALGWSSETSRSPAQSPREEPAVPEDASVPLERPDIEENDVLHV